MKIKVGQRILLGNSIIITLFITVSLILFFNLRKLEDNSNWVEHTHKVIGKGNRLISLMVDQETGMRGFLATGNEVFLKPFNSEKEEFSKLIKELQETVSDNKAQVQLLNEVEILADLWLNQAAMNYINIRKDINQYDQYNDRVLKRIKSGIGKSKMDALRVSIDKLPNEAQRNRMVLDLVNMETGLRGYLVTGDTTFLEPYNLGQKNLEKDLRLLNSTAITNQALDWIEEYAEVQISDKLSASKFRDREDLNLQLSKNEGKKFMDKLRQDIGLFISREDELLIVRDKTAQTTRSVSYLALILGAILASLLGMIVSGRISRTITSQMGGEPDEIAGIVEEIANGNLAITFDDRESRGIFNSMKHMSLKLRQIIGETKSRTETLSEIGVSLSSNAEQSSATLTQVTSSVYTISNNFNNLLNSVEEVTAAVTQITGNIDSLNHSINQQNTQIAESSSSIEEMVGSIISVTENMDKVYKATGELQEASQAGQTNVNRSNEQIKEVAEESTKLMQTNQLISSIANQTNLLAMNAAIEAAHAGDAGKGFAVVADEIRKLAESTTEQSHGVSEILKHINTLITEIVNSSEDSVESFNKIYSMVNTVNGRTEEVQMALNEQKAGSEQILESLNMMSRIADTVKGGADEIKNGSNLVMNEVIQLKDTTNESHIQISEIATSTKEIDEAVVNVRNVSLTNKEMVSSIDEEVSFFSL